MRVTRQLIDTGWRVREVTSPEMPAPAHLPWLPARVPGHVHLDLMRAGVIPDPFARLHERDVAWVAESDWEYETTFTVDDPVPGHAYLLFHGLDTVAEIALNGDPLGKVENMFVPHEFPVDGRLRAGENHLSVTFRSALRVGRERWDTWNTPGTSDAAPPNWDNWASRSFVRKAQYMYGWDWGPILPSCGLWRPVELVSVPTARLGDWSHTVRFTSDGDAIVTVEAEVERSPIGADLPLTLAANVTRVGYLEGDFKDVLPVPVSVQVPTGQGKAKVTASLTIDKPRRWNPVGLNDGTQFDGSHPPLYTLELSLEDHMGSAWQADPVQGDEATRARAKGLNLQYVPLSANYSLDPAAIKSVPEYVVRRYGILPIKRDGYRMMVAVSDPRTSIQGLDDIRLITRCEITPVLANSAALQRAIARAYDYPVDKITAKIGLRTIELVREPDADGQGEGFKFRVNGHDVFMKGANWIPEDSFPSRLENEPGEVDFPSDDRVRQRIASACDAGFNMLRVWGGGLFESEHFYEMCDAHGILVWQDFPYACALYPDTGEYAEAARVEATAAVRRIRNHPSLALWCGNNENDMFFAHEDDPKRHRYFGEKLYQEVLPAVVAAEDPATPYWPSSPYGGKDRGDANSAAYGDCHNWDVWHGRGDWKHYTENDARFCSEFGFAASCGLAAWGTVLDPQDRHPHSPVVRWHDKTRKGYDTYLGYVGLHFPDPQTLEDLVYYSQLNQAEALKFGVEHYRRRKGHCWGTLFWQFNDCWPVQSWAIIDSQGEPKAAYYACRKFYAPVLVSLVQSEQSAEVHLVSDRLHALAGTLTLTLQTFDGETLAEETHAVGVGHNGAERVASFPLAAAQGRERDVFLHASFASEDGQEQAENFLFLAEPKDWRTSDPGLKVTVTEDADANGFRLSLFARRFAPYVWLRRADDAPLFEGTGIGDNFFHLRPGETREFVVPKTETLPTVETLRGQLVVRTL